MTIQWTRRMNNLFLIPFVFTAISFCPVVSSEFLKPQVLDFTDFQGWRITASSTCGVEVDSRGNEKPFNEMYCLIDGALDDSYFVTNPGMEVPTEINGQFCSSCNPMDPLRNHSAVFALDATRKWWQSPPLSRGKKYREVNLTIDLGQELLISYLYIQPANSPRPALWVLEKSKDYGVTYTPWQYFASSIQQCEDVFNIDPIQKPTRDDSVLCDTTQSKLIEPVKTGVNFDKDEIIIPLVKNRPSAENYYKSPLLQDWTKATNIRLRFLQPNTHKADLMSLATEDPSVTRRHFYSVRHISMASYCVCNGHASACYSKNSGRNFILMCECEHNTCGIHCDSCCEGFVQKKWKPSAPEDSFICEPCNCFGHSDECEYDPIVEKNKQSLDIHGRFEGGGVCKNCKHNTMGINCNRCKPGFYHPYNTPMNTTESCKACKCDERFHKPNFCRDGSGQCECKPQYNSPKCDSCVKGFYGYPACQRCKCDPKRTEADTCDAKTGDCKCKQNFGGKMCETCAEGYYNFPYCHSCKCSEKGAISKICDRVTGQCQCNPQYGGAKCSKCRNGHFDFPKCTRCSCDQDGTEADICNKKTGVCICREGYQGKKCDQCEEGRYNHPECIHCNCSIEGSNSVACDSFGNCSCRHNFYGRKCDQCSIGYYSYPKCLECKCHPIGSLGISCDDDGKCMCKADFGGSQCNQCVEGYYGFPNCTACNCNPKGVVKDSIGCKPLPTGELCPCKKNVQGKLCDECKEHYWNLTALNPEGCDDCSCHIPGVVGHTGKCNPQTGKCPCKYLVESQRCEQCRDGTYHLRADNLLGCSDCGCSVGGSFNRSCHDATGQCHCKPNVKGRRCLNPIDGYYFPTLHQFQYEAEDGRTASDEDIQHSFNETEFPGYSWKGYVAFSSFQSEISLNIERQKSNKYQVVFRCLNLEEYPIRVTITLTPEKTSTNSKKTFQVRIQPMAKPSFITVIDPSHDSSSSALWEAGTWSLAVKTDSHLLLDYVVIIPLDYYEATALTKSINNACTLEELKKEEFSFCKHFCYPKVSQFHMAVGKPDSSSKGKLHLRDCFDDEKALEESVKLSFPLIDSHNNSLMLKLELSRHGEYVLVIVYNTSSNKSAAFEVDIESSSGKGKNHGKITLYSCHYSSLCRQVVQSEHGKIKIFHFSKKESNLSLSWTGDGFLDVISIVAIPHKKWSLGYIMPQPACVKVNGKCLTTPVDNYSNSKKIHFPSVLRHKRTRIFPYGLNGRKINLIHLDIKDEMISLKGNTSAPGKYAFVIHYYQPDYTGFDLMVEVDNGKTYKAKVHAAHCPSHDGCYSTVERIDESKYFRLNDKFLFTLRKINHTTIWLENLIMVSEEKYAVSARLPAEETNLSNVFTSHCIEEGFYISKNTSEFCRDSLFMVTTKYNDGPLPCECNAEGSENSHCEKFGGQCACKPNVIGRKCEQCSTGYYGFPDCSPCDCPPGLLCQPKNGSCICPPHTTGRKCEKCTELSYGHDPYFGCKKCNCSALGVKENELQCDAISGVCTCRENIEGRTCDRCSPGFSSFPNCTKCDCNMAGSTPEICDRYTGKCICRKNIAGEACDVCAVGTFNLEEKNPDGCSPCFCFDRTKNCSSSSLFRSKIINMQDWHLVELSTENELLSGDRVSLKNYKEKLKMLGSGIQVNFTSDAASRLFYFAASPPYLGNKITSYGGVLNFTVKILDPELPATTFAADIILHGASVYLFHQLANQSFDGGNKTFSVELIETNFKMTNHTPSSRDVFMLALKNLDGLFIRAPNVDSQTLVSLNDVILETADVASTSEMKTALPVEQCVCPENYKGLSCEECAPGYYHSTFGKYGGDCIPCQCNGHAEVCDPYTGVCLECKHNTSGDHCEKCGRGFYGHPSRGTPYDCQRCACPLITPSNNFADECEMLDDGVSIKCDCRPGYHGQRCEICAVGYFGKPDEEGEICKPCDCFGNINPEEHGSCDPVTGKCMKCLNNTYGDDCGQCAPGYFGDAIHLKSCQECRCDMCGTDLCHGETGVCECKEHVVGEKCEKCAPNHWNFSSCQGCSSCDCQPASESLQCDLLTGQCPCQTGVTGQTCDQCAPGYWNYTADGCTPCGCHEKYSLGDTCDSNTGQCQCSYNLIGEKCDYCQERWILMPNEGCMECDLCIHTLLDESDTSSISRVLLDLRSLKEEYHANQKITFLNETAYELFPLVSSLIPSSFDAQALVDDVSSLKEGSKKLNKMTEILNGKLEKLEKDGLEMFLEVMDAEIEIGKTIAQINETVMKTKSLTFNIIETDSQFIKEAQRLLKNIEEIDLSKYKNSALRELEKCRKDLSMVKDIVSPVENQTHFLSALKTQVLTLNDKLEHLKNESKKSKDKAEQASDMIGKMGIPKLTNKINILVNLTNEVNGALKEAQQYIKNATKMWNEYASANENLKIIKEKLTQMNSLIENRTTSYEEELKGLHKLCDQAKAHVNTLIEKEEKLNGLFSNIHDTSERAVQAANAYNNIVSAINSAMKSAEHARSAGDRAYSMTEGLSKKVGASSEMSSKLLLNAKDAINITQTVLMPNLKQRQVQVKDVELLNRHTNESMKSINGTLETILSQEIYALLENASNAAEKAIKWSKDALPKITNIAERTPEQLAIAKGLSEIISGTNSSISNGKHEGKKVTENVHKMIRVSKRVEKEQEYERNNQSLLQDEINKLLKEIHNFNEQMKRINVGVKLLEESYLVLRNPPALSQFENSGKVSLFFRTNEINGLLLYLGNEVGTSSNSSKSTFKTDDYMALQIENGLPTLTIELGSGPAKMELEKYVADNQWYQIIAKRSGRSAELTIREEIKTGGLEKVKNYSNFMVLTGPSSILNLEQNLSRLIVGGYPKGYKIQTVIHNSFFNGEMQELYIGDNPVSFWNFIKKGNIRASYERDQLISPKKGLKFGGDGYAILKFEKSSRWTADRLKKQSTIQLRFKTHVKDGLLFLVEKGGSFLSIELIAGKITYQFNLGDSVTTLESMRSYDDDLWHSVEAVRYKNSAKLTVDVDDEVKDESSGKEENLNVSDNFYIGGYSGEHNLPNVTQKKFNGCIEDVVIESSIVDLSAYVKAYGIVPGCPTEVNNFVSFIKDREGYIRWSGINADEDFQLNFKFNTTHKNALLFYATDPSQMNTLSLSLVNGTLILNGPQGKMHVSSSSGASSNPIKYNDGKWHAVTATYESNTLTLDIDDYKHFQSERSDLSLKINNGDIYFGGLPGGFYIKSTHVQNHVPFIGCIGDATFGRTLIHFENASEIHNIILGCALTGKIIYKRPEALIQPALALVSPDEGCIVPRRTTSDRDEVAKNGYRFGTKPHSHLVFQKPPYVHRHKYKFAVEFNTDEKDGIILYVADQSHRKFIALYMHQGKVVFRYNCGSTVETLQTLETKNDGRWRTITVMRAVQKAKLFIDGRMHDTSESHCSTMWMKDALFHYLGGVPSEIKANVKENLGLIKSFSGCLRNFNDSADTVYNNVLHGLIPCSEQVEKGIFFAAEGGYVKIDKRFPDALVMKIEMEIKPHTSSGFLMSVHGSKPKDYLGLRMFKGSVIFSVGKGRRYFSTVFKPSNQSSLCNGEWHRIVAQKNKNVIALEVDSIQQDTEYGPPGSHFSDTVDQLILGGNAHMRGAKSGPKSKQQFVGCMRNIKITYNAENNNPINEEDITPFDNVFVGVCPTN